MADDRKRYNRRDFLADTVRWLAVLAAGGALGPLATRALGRDTVWQIDPNKCTHCDKCATQCVLAPSAVKCIHAYAMCGYCKLCFGFFRDQRPDNGAGAENVRCPTDAIRRSPVEDPVLPVHHRRGALHRLRGVRGRLQSLRQRLAFPADTP